MKLWPQATAPARAASNNKIDKREAPPSDGASLLSYYQRPRPAPPPWLLPPPMPPKPPPLRPAPPPWLLPPLRPAPPPWLLPPLRPAPPPWLLAAHTAETAETASTGRPRPARASRAAGTAAIETAAGGSAVMPTVTTRSSAAMRLESVFIVFMRKVQPPVCRTACPARWLGSRRCLSGNSGPNRYNAGC